MRPDSFRKIGWFIAIWLMSVLALGIVAYAIRFAINP
ncbi:DUF2474 domain-containing protein [Sulfitobacter pseudonitzschiae]|uniref:DUF2474 domain-containing protein n=1 Tax=Pseudosulfitobacter pseudonitzschiae TaxID=1402135 RepID=A0A9Q2NNW6_9RHOB|nr:MULTISPECIES: DUF2474 domain-containing protein [Roseobacteraceae]MBM2293244.1 DUF2474 domain-containing protein [Pseudosulfitobacter pseudonitzschiae]MBM2297931.1 DUF2474 domain-containing protein [Pseudosulfitobacter pseudonitzschiae]MBM2302845.1 DUF2474 domain-containing protein [Pseudosulfitobacter pseudonitzschiae]MBM2312489.1 DUF2474 domain-containing protein [Pseudosulfitobacter pseudonitzschiae]MBM2317541.1 DUF2474 domain-containing protein [Pseudosulfitobacter pseudonitzschiae]